jgi:hypothetical protein
MNRATVAAAIAAVVVITFQIGVAYARARRGWVDWQTTRDAVPGLRRGMFGAIGMAFRWGAGLVAVLAVLTALARRH